MKVLLNLLWKDYVTKLLFSPNFSLFFYNRIRNISFRVVSVEAMGFSHAWL